MTDIKRERMNSLYDAYWEKIDYSVRRRAVESLRSIIEDELADQIRAGIAAHGRHEWIHHDPFDHSFFGMQVRNHLRQDGLPDAVLPPFDEYYGEGTDVRNWDDAYIQALETAVGERELGPGFQQLPIDFGDI